MVEVSVYMVKDTLEIAKDVLRIEAEAVSELISKLDENFTKAVKAILQCRGRVIVTGMGKSGIIGKKISATLASTGTPAFFMHPAEAIHGDLGMVTSDDIVLAISNSGSTEELLKIIPFLKRFDITLIALTGNPASALARCSDIHIDVSVKEEACPLGIVPTASTTAALAMGDAIAVALLSLKGFNEQDFASFHPGGALGMKLFVKVSELMHTGEELPIIYPDTSMIDALMVISAGRLGMAVVLTAQNQVVGIVTDGDIRRGVQKWGKSFLDMSAGTVMTQNPKTISGDALAAKALSIMQKHSITSLIVAEEDKSLKGIIHLHDILKKGII